MKYLCRISFPAILAGLCLLLATGISPADTPKSVAVLPFTNLMGDDSLNWLRSGIAATLTTKLASVQSLRVVERSEIGQAIKEIAFAQTGLVDPKTAAQTGKLVGAEIMIVGEYQKAGDTLRLTSRFVSVQTGEITRSAEATGPLNDVFSLQDQIAFRLVETMGVSLSDQERQKVTKKPTDSVPAYAAFWNAFNAQEQFETDPGQRDRLEFALKEFRKSVELDPKWQAAYRGLARALHLHGDLDEAVQWYRKALQINEKEPLSHLGLGNVYKDQKRDDEAIAEYERAIELKPDLARAHFMLATALERKNTRKAVRQWQQYLEVARSLLSEARARREAEQHLQSLKDSQY